MAIAGKCTPIHFDASVYASDSSRDNSTAFADDTVMGTRHVLLDAIFNAALQGQPHPLVAYYIIN